MPQGPINHARDFLAHIRRRVLIMTVGIAMAAVAMISLTTVPAWPVLGVAVAAVAVAVNSAASRLRTDDPSCLACGGSLKDVSAGTHGAICPDCGSINQPYVTDPDERA